MCRNAEDSFEKMTNKSEQHEQNRSEGKHFGMEYKEKYTHARKAFKQKNDHR